VDRPLSLSHAQCDLRLPSQPDSITAVVRCRYQIILLADRGTCPESLPGNGVGALNYASTAISFSADRKRNAFWQSTVEAERSNPKRLWQTIDTLLGRGRPPVNGEISADRFQKYFENKVASVRASTESAPAPDFLRGPAGVSLSKLDPVDCREVADAIR